MSKFALNYLTPPKSSEDDKLKVVGLPFYNNRTQNKFKTKFQEVLNVK